MPAPPPDELSLLIDGREFLYWTDLEVQLALDNFSTVKFSAPFEPERPEFRAVFRPFSYKPIQVLLDGAVLFTGQLDSIDPQADPNQRTVEVSAYATPGVVADCGVPGDALPAEFQKLDLRHISDALLRPFGLTSEFRDPPGTPFAKVKLDIEQEIHAFLVDLARQRNLVISSTPDGKLLYWRAVEPGRPVATLVEAVAPVSKATAQFNSREYFSEITGFAPAGRRKGGAKYTARNPWLTTPLRPKTFKLDDTEKGDAPEASKAALGRMFGNAVSWELPDLPTWRDPSGALWGSNTTIVLTAPGAMIYNPTELCIRTVTLKRDANTKTATLGLCLPAVFSGVIPKELPWDV